jgi:hypothetical protein
MRERRWQRLREMGIVTCDLSEREPDLPAPHYLAHKEAWDAKYGPGEKAIAKMVMEQEYGRLILLRQLFLTFVHKRACWCSRHSPTLAKSRRSGATAACA